VALLLAGQTFDAASVKPAEQQSGFLAPVRAGNAGRVTYRNYTLRLLLAEAFGLSEYQVIGPSWLSRERYDIVATRPRASGPDAIPAMLRALLTERFHLQSHREMRTMQSWALLPDKDTSKLRPAKNVGEVAGCNSWGDMAGFAGLLAKVLERPVVDETGIAGSFFYILYIVPGLSAPPSGGVSPPPPKVVVIDKADRVPERNQQNITSRVYGWPISVIAGKEDGGAGRDRTDE
jgi:uncharacterized protein (TIGR03435 family)